MLLESKAAMSVATLAAAGIFAAWNSVGPWAQDLVLAAAAIAAIKVIGGALRRVVKVGAEVHDAVTSKLPSRVGELEREAGEMRAELMVLRGVLEVHGTVEAAAVRGAIESQRRPRAARASDPGMRTGWRE